MPLSEHIACCPVWFPSDNNGSPGSVVTKRISGLVYVFVISAAATGTYFLIALSITLVLRPSRGISQTVQKLGSERGEAVSSYARRCSKTGPIHRYAPSGLDVPSDVRLFYAIVTSV